jgi:predicted transport protein
MTVVLNLDFEDVVDETGFCRDASRQSFVINSSVKGGAILEVSSDADIDRVMPFIRQAYEDVYG